MLGKRSVLLFVLSATLSIAAIPDHIENQPIDTVLVFNRCYGTDCMAEIPKITTERFLNNMPATVWVFNALMFLFQKKYQRLSFEMVSTKVSGNLAEVVGQVKISTQDGEKWQTEVYLLIKRNGFWFIDEVTILDMGIDGF